ncbi:MAG: hypothetical protein JW866_08535, partial [Ignavibacteriales bacterium]|nr:hypothetical protein [Ignavibacteriales bacterium]
IFFFCLANLYLGMRGILELGGFVAEGGPYAIQHPAPDWIWIMPVSIFLGAISFLFSQIYSKKIGGWSLILPMWSLLFLSLGENFLEYSFLSVNGETVIAWGWLICGILFVIMGAAPLLLAKNVWKSFIMKKKFYTQGVQYSMFGKKIINDEDVGWPKGKIKKVLLVCFLIAAVIGVFLGVEYFNYLIS